MKLAKLKDVIKSDLIIYDASSKVTFNNVDVSGRVFTDHSDYHVIGVRAVTRYVPHTRKYEAYIVVSVRRMS